MDSLTFFLVPNIAKFDCDVAAGSVTFDLSQAGRPATFEICDFWYQKTMFASRPIYGPR